MIDEKGKRHPSPPAAPLIPPHMLDGFNPAQRKALGIKKASAPATAAEKAPAKRAAKKSTAKKTAAETPASAPKAKESKE
jgi:hypothetical protein